MRLARVAGYLLFALCVQLAAALVANADNEASQVGYVVAAPYGRYYFKMVPDPKHRYDRRKGTGTAFEVSEVGADKLLWRTSG